MIVLNGVIRISEEMFWFAEKYKQTHIKDYKNMSVPDF